MESYKSEFIEFMVRCGALRFGEFITKSGRQTPFFINTGQFDSGARLARLGRFYAAALQDRLKGEFDLLFGPAYKGIPLVAAAAAALAEHFDCDRPFLFNRKEAKDHGEGGSLIGRKPKAGDRVVLIDDVVTAGISVRESMSILTAAARVKIAALIVSVDRQERGTGEKSALQELRDDHGIDAFAIVTLDEIVETLHGRKIDGATVIDDAMLKKIEGYREQYGVKIS